MGRLLHQKGNKAQTLLGTGWHVGTLSTLLLMECFVSSHGKS